MKPPPPAQGLRSCDDAHQDSPQTRVYSYGARVIHHEQAMGILRKANEYRNRWVEIEHARRAAVDALCVRLAPALGPIEKELSDLNAVMEKKENQTKELRARRKELSARRKELRTALFASDEFKDEQKTIDADTLAAEKAARAACGIAHGTYLAVEESLGGRRSGAPPIFTRFTGEGRIGIQIQGGMSIVDIQDTANRRCHIERPSDTGRCPWQPGRIRIGSDDNRNPVWLDFAVKLHRPVPADARIQRIYLVARRVGLHTKWTLQFTLRRASWPRVNATSGSVALYLGWERQADGIRVAQWLGSDGDAGRLVTPNDVLNRQRKCAELQSIRDQNYDAIKATLKAYLPNAPQWLQERCATIAQWRSQARLASVALAWRDAADGSSTVRASVEEWRRQDKHLLTWQAHQRQGITEWRKNNYRVFSATVATKYQTAIVHALNLKAMQVREAVDGTPDAAKEYRRLACLHLLCQTLANRMPLVKVEGDIHSACGCCGKPREQKEDGSWTTCCVPHEENACLNLMRSHVSQEDMSALFRTRGIRTINKVATSTQKGKQCVTTHSRWN